MMDVFDNMASKLNLGQNILPVQRVNGGYMHKMYKLETTTGKYAVKLLNPTIMKRPDVFDNYERAEQLEKVLVEQGLPVVPALEFNGSKMQCIDNQYFYIFNWVEAKAIPWNEINREHCKIAGELLAGIHRIKLEEKAVSPDLLDIDWDKYIELAKSECPEIFDKLLDNRNLLYSAQQEYNQALESAPAVVSICDGDMDSKNVLWLDGRPLIIDLECLDYGNPYLEMFQLALSWAGGVICKVNFDYFNAFVKAYKQVLGEIKVDLKSLYGIGFSWLDWLEYNVKRALMLECDNEEERKLGISEVHGSIARIVYYASIKEELLKEL